MNIKNKDNIDNILVALSQGALTIEEAANKLRLAPYQELFEGLNVDQQRQKRTGFGETVLAEGKSFERLFAAIKALGQNYNQDAILGSTAKLATSEGTQAKHSPVLATRVSPEQGQQLLQAFSSSENHSDVCVEFWEEARLFSYAKPLKLSPPWTLESQQSQDKRLIIVTAGASDLPVALEALGTAKFYGLNPILAPDLGVAGLHRLSPWLDLLYQAELIIAVAGMDGALPSVLAGICRCPVLGVPSAVGYGVATGGYSALLNMLSSCAPGLATLNVGNGYGAAMFAAKMLANKL